MQKMDWQMHTKIFILCSFLFQVWFQVLNARLWQKSVATFLFFLPSVLTFLYQVTSIDALRCSRLSEHVSSSHPNQYLIFWNLMTKASCPQYTGKSSIVVIKIQVSSSLYRRWDRSRTLFPAGILQYRLVTPPPPTWWDKLHSSKKHEL